MDYIQLTALSNLPDLSALRPFIANAERLRDVISGNPLLPSRSVFCRQPLFRCRINQMRQRLV